jgi:molecular chaperone DnaJ
VPALKGSFDQRGDQYIKLAIQVPKKLNREAKALLQQLAAVLGEESAPEPIPFSE